MLPLTISSVIPFSTPFTPGVRHISSPKLCTDPPIPMPIRRSRTTATMVRPVVVASSLNSDISIEVPVAPRAGETVIGGAITQSLGGKGANTAVAASRGLSCESCVYLAASRGSDSEGESMHRMLSSLKVDVSLMQTIDKIRTGSAYILVEKNGENRIIVTSGANGHFSKVLTPDFWTAVENSVVVLHLEIPIESVHAIACGARERGALSVFNPSPITGDTEAIESVLRNVDYVIVNEIEVAQLTGIADDCPRAARLLWENCGTHSTVVVTRGKEPVVFVEGGEIGFVETVRARSVVDTTSAGDTVTGYFAAGIAKGLSVRETLRTAVAAASITVERRGASISIPDMDEVERRMLELAV